MGGHILGTKWPEMVRRVGRDRVGTNLSFQFTIFFWNEDVNRDSSEIIVKPILRMAATEASLIYPTVYPA